MSFLFRLLLLVLIISLVRRLIAALMGRRRRFVGQARAQTQASAPRTITGKMIKDPYCGTYVASELAVTARSAGQTLYFCSRECRDRYLLAQPEKAPVG